MLSRLRTLKKKVGHRDPTFFIQTVIVDIEKATQDNLPPAYSIMNSYFTEQGFKNMIELSLLCFRKKPIDAYIHCYKGNNGDGNFCRLFYIGQVWTGQF